MAQYDGSIRINTKIDTKGFKDGEKEIESESRRMAESVSKTTDQIEKELENLKNAQKSFLEAGGKKASPVYQQYEKEISELQNTLQSLKNTQNDTEIADEHWNLLRIDVEEYAKSLKELHDQGKFFGDEDYNKVYLAWKNATDAVKTYQSELNKQTESGQAKIAQQEAKAAEKREAAQRRAEEQAEKALQKENARIQKEVENQAKLEAKEAERKAREEARINAIQAKEEAKRAKEIAAIQAQEQEEQRLAAIRENAVVGNQRIVEIMERRRQLAQEIADMEQAGVGVGYQQHDTAKQELASLDQEIKNYADGVEEVKESYSRLGQAAKKAFSIAHSAISKAGSGLKRFGGFVKSVFSSLTKSAHKSNSSLGALGARFKSLALSLLIFNQISKAFNAMISGMKEGFGNLYNEVGAFKSAIDGLKASSLTLKNSFAAAFRPLVEIAIPYIQRAIDAIANLMNIIGQFTAAITGQKTYTKAVKQTTAAIKEQTGAQNRQLSSLDKLNNLSSNKGGGSGGSGAGNMFEEAPIESGILGVFDKLKELIENKDWEGLGAYIAEAINKGLQKVYDVINWNNVGPKVTAFVDAFTRTFNSLVDHLDWDLLGRVIGAGINTIVNTLNLLIEGIDWENLGVKISTGMRGLINEVNWGNLGNLLGSKFMIQWDIFTGFVDDMWRKNDFTKLTGWAELGISLGNALNGVFEKVDLAKIGATLGRAVTGIFQSVIYLSETFRWKELGDNVANGINNFFSETNWATVGQGFSDFVIGLLDALIAAIEGTNWRQIGTSIGTFLANIDWGKIIYDALVLLFELPKILWDTLSGVIQSIDWGQLVTDIAVAIKTFFEEYDWAGWFNSLGEFIGSIFAAVFDIAGVLGEAIMNTIDSLKEYFLGYIMESLSGLDEDANILDIGIAIVQGMLNGILDAISAIGNWIYENIFSPFIEGFKNAFGIHSPSTVMEEMGNFLMEGLFNGISSLVEKVISIFGDIKEKISEKWEAIKENTSEVWENIKGSLSDTWENVKSNASDTFENVKNWIGDKWNSVKENTGNTWESIKKTVNGTTNELSSNVSGGFGVMKSEIKKAWSSANESTADEWNSINRNVSGNLESLEGSSRGTFGNIATHIRDTWQNVKSNTQSSMDETGRKVINTWNESQRNTAQTWDSMKSTVVSSASSMETTMNSRLTSMKGNISSFSSNIKTMWSTTYDNIKTKNTASWSEISQASNNAMRDVGNTVSHGMNQAKNTWGSIWDSIFGKVRDILGSIQDAVSSAMNAISGMISNINGALDNLFAKAESASKISVSSKGGSGGSGGKKPRMADPRIEALAETPIPRLATGTVVPPNNEFLAVLGDNKRETEVVSPLSTIEQAVENAMRRNGGMGGGEITIKIPVEIDGNVLFELIKKLDLEQYKRTQRPSFQM